MQFSQITYSKLEPLRKWMQNIKMIIAASVGTSIYPIGRQNSEARRLQSQMIWLKWKNLYQSGQSNDAGMSNKRPFLVHHATIYNSPTDQPTGRPGQAHLIGIERCKHKKSFWWWVIYRELSIYLSFRSFVRSFVRHSIRGFGNWRSTESSKHDHQLDNISILFCK